MTTITDVAKKAGVSVKTVSRVMNDYEHVSVKTRDKVERAIHELSYAPNSISRQMLFNANRFGANLSIGILFSDPSGGYQSRLNHALLKACFDAGRYLAVELFDERGLDWSKQVEGFLDRTRVHNLILVPPMCDSTDLHDTLKARGVNFVLISPSRAVSGASAITMDDRLAAKEMVNHLMGLGHRRIGHIGGHPDHVATLLRRQGYEEALHKVGIIPRQDYVCSGRFKFRTALRCAGEMLSLAERPTAIFAANDEMAAAVITAANRLGLKVPEDLSVVGFDDTTITKTIWPELTTVAQPYDEIARVALESVNSNKSTSHERPHTLILKHELIIRDSAGPAPTA